MSQQSAPDTGAVGTPDMGITGPNSEQEQGTPDTGTTGPDTTDYRAEAAKFAALAKKHEQQAKENVAAAKELARVRREAMSEQDRAVSEATERARSEAAAEVVARLGGRLVVSEIRAAVAGRLTAEQLDAVTEHLELSGFLSETGDVDLAAVTAFAQRIAPEVTPSPTFPDLGQGPRTPTTNGNASDPLLSAL